MMLMQLNTNVNACQPTSSSQRIDTKILLKTQKYIGRDISYCLDADIFFNRFVHDIDKHS